MESSPSGSFVPAGFRDDPACTPGRFALVLAVLVFAAFPDVLLGLATFRYRDFGFYSYPVAHHLRESLLRGEIPLWNALSNCGIPFLAHWSHLALYPPSLFYVVFPLSWALGVFCVLHLYLAGLGMYFLAYHWTNHRLAASLAGVIFAFNGLTINCLMWSQYMAVIGWTPWVIYATHRAWSEGGRRVPIAAAVGALQMLGGTPEFILFTWLIILGHFVFQSPAPGAGIRIRALRLMTVVALITGLSAAQLLPFLDLLLRSQRDSAFATNTWSMPPTGWANFLVPQFRCYFNKDGSVSQYGQYFTSSYYCGIGTILLALMAFSRTPNRQVLFVGTTASLALALALGEHAFPYEWLRKLLPISGVMRYPAKFVFIAVVCLPLLAAAGFKAFQYSSPETRRANRSVCVGLGGLICAAMAGIVLYAWFFPFGDENWPMTWTSAATRAAFLVIFIGAACGLKPPVSIGRLRFVAVTLGLLHTADVATHLPRQSPTTLREAYAPLQQPAGMQPVPTLGAGRAMISRPADQFLKYLFTANPTNDYALSRTALFSNCNLLDNIPKVDGFFPLYTRENDRLTRFLYSTNVNLPTGLLDFLSVTHLTRPGTFFEWNRRADALPWITSGQAPVFVPDETAFATITGPSFNPRTTVLLPEMARGTVSATTGTHSRILSSSVDHHQVRVEVTNGAPALVVIAQNHDPHWTADIDGQRVTIWKANHGFQAVEVPAGNHRLRMRYVDWPFRIGVGVSLCSACLIFLYFRRTSWAGQD